MKHLMPNDPRTKFHEVLAVILKGVIKGLRTGLATCRFLYIATIGSAPSISLYAPITKTNKINLIVQAESLIFFSYHVLQRLL
jgi:hypothetical protein